MFLHLVDRKTAKAHGLKRYFTGEPCKNGGIAERLVGGACLCGFCKEKAKGWATKNKEARRDSVRRYRERNHNSLLEKRRQWYAENKENESQRAKTYRIQNNEKEAERKNRYYEENKKRLSDYFMRKNKDYYAINKERLKSSAIESYYRNPNKVKEQKKIYYSKNKDKYRAWRAKRKAAKLNATPSWYGELDEFVLVQAYELCRLREQCTGFPWQIDHMIPLQAKNVCGLHVWNNFQVIPATLNNWKRNKLIFTEPNEWLEYLIKEKNNGNRVFQ